LVRRKPKAIHSSVVKSWTAVLDECDNCEHFIEVNNLWGMYCDGRDIYLQKVNIGVQQTKCPLFKPKELELDVVPLCNLCKEPAETIEVIDNVIPLVEFRCNKHHDLHSGNIVYIDSCKDPIAKMELMISICEKRNSIPDRISLKNKLAELSDTELKTYNLIKEGEMVVKCLPNECKGALGRLIGLSLISFDTIYKQTSERVTRSFKTVKIKDVK